MKEDALGKILSLSPVFSEASHDARALLCACNVHSFSGGDIIYSPEHFFCGIGIVISGALAIHGKNGEKDVLLNIIDKGEMFGAAALFGGSGEYLNGALRSRKKPAGGFENSVEVKLAGLSAAVFRRIVKKK